MVQQYAAMCLVNLTCGVPATKAAVAAAVDWAGMGNLLTWLAAAAQEAAASEAAAAAAVAGGQGGGGSGSEGAGAGPSSTAAAGGAAAREAETIAAAAAAAALSGGHPQPLHAPPPATTTTTNTTTAAHGSGSSAPTAPASVATAAAAATAAATSDLRLYTTWLMQHLSLSPLAAAVMEPGCVVPPLVALMSAPDAHVRLRSAAALGALCSAAGSVAVPSQSQPQLTGSRDAPAAVAASGVTAAEAASPASNSANPAGAAPAIATAATATTAAAPSAVSHTLVSVGARHRAAFLAAGGVRQLVAAAARERDPHLLAYQMLALSSAVGEDDAAAVAEAVGAGALGVLEVLLASDAAACIVPAAETLQALANAVRCAAAASGASGATAGATAAAAAADVLPRSLLGRVVAVMLTHGDPRVRAALNEALGAVTALPGVRERYCAVFAETLRDLVSAAEVELRVIPVN